MADTGEKGLETLLRQPSSASLLPELAAMTPSQRADTAPGRDVLEWARAAFEVQTIPETTYTLYREYRRSGVRETYEKPYYEKRTLLTQEVMAAWFTGDDTRLNRIDDLIWSICEETTWVFPAHEKKSWTVDLFSAETASELAHVSLLLGDRLPEELRTRIYDEADRRIFVPYLEHHADYWWDEGGNNWTGVCAGSIGEAALILERDPTRLARILQLVIAQLGRFTDNAFAKDGGSLEGMSYWNYGLLHLVGFSEMMRARTNGAVDLLQGDRMRAIAAFPLSVAIGPGRFASFSDSRESSPPMAFLTARLAERTGCAGLRSLTPALFSWRLTSVLRNVIWWNAAGQPNLEYANAFLPDSGIARLSGAAGGVPIVLVARAGHNDEPHNHNDVGSFVLSAGQRTYLCDPGGGFYSRQYFSTERYDNIFASSYGHSVPRIARGQQAPGEKHRGVIESLNDHAVRIGFAEAYTVPELKQADRVISLQDNEAVIEDTFAFDGPGAEVEEALVTWLDPEIDGDTVRLRTEDGMLEMRTSAGVFAAERLEEACRANHKEGVLTRLSVTYPAAPKTEARVTITFTPTR